MARHRRIGEPIHYRDWFEMMLAEGHRVEGKDPLATFLTQVTRSPVVLREPEHTGVYRVDFEAGAEHALRQVDAFRGDALALQRQLAEEQARENEAEIAVLLGQVDVSQRRVLRGSATRTMHFLPDAYVYCET